MTNKTTAEEIDKFKMDTIFDPESGQIMIDQVCENRYGIMQRLQRDVIKTKEEHIRKALIGLGWIPPTDEGESRLNDIAEQVEGLKQHDKDGYNSYWNNALNEVLKIITKYTE